MLKSVVGCVGWGAGSNPASHARVALSARACMQVCDLSPHCIRDRCKPREA